MISSHARNFAQTPFIRKAIRVSDLRTFSTQPVVSVITAFYNTGEIFRETLYSILHQTYPHFEWLILNDCSTDENSLQLLKEAAQSDSRIRVINNSTNIGLSATRNYGAQCAKGAYLFFIDSDDMVELSYLEKCLICLELNPHFSFVSSYTIGFDAKEYLWEHGYLQPQRFLKNNHAVNCFVCRRTVFDQLEYRNIREGMEDWDFWLHAASLGLWGYTIPEFLYWYRERLNRAEDWPNIFNANKRQVFIERLNERYAQKVSAKTFNTSLSKETHHIRSIETLNFPGSGEKNILFILNSLPEDNQQLIVCDYLRFFQSQGASITVLIHNLEGSRYVGDFSDITDDLFITDHLCANQNREAVWQYLITSRNIQRVIAVNLPADPQELSLIKVAFPLLQTDIILMSLPRHAAVDEVIQRYKLGTSCVDHIGVSTQEIRFILETDISLYGKVYFIPPVTEYAIQPAVLKQVHQQKKEWGIRSAAFTIALTGNIGAEHFGWLQVLLDLLKKNEHNRCVFIIRAWGPVLKFLKKIVPSMEFPGNMLVLSVEPHHTNFEEMLAIADCVLDISNLDGFNDTLREAIRRGIPVLSIGNKGIKDVVDPQTGKRFLNYKDPKTLVTDLLATVMELSCSPVKMNTLRKNCLQKAGVIFSNTHPSALQFCRLEKNLLP